MPTGSWSGVHQHVYRLPGSRPVALVLSRGIRPSGLSSEGECRESGVLDRVSGIVAQSTVRTAAADGVPFLDLAYSHGPLARDILDDVATLVETGAFTNGPQVGVFERAFAEYCGADHCVGTASGLDAPRFALLGLGLQPGDEVLVPAMTFIATFEAVTQAGGDPVPVDVSLSDACIDPDAMSAAVRPRTRAVMPVHLYGRLADMRAIKAVADSNDLMVIEDACQAHGAVRDETCEPEQSGAPAPSASTPARTSEPSATPARW